MKKLFDAPLGSDGEIGAKIENGFLKLEVGYKVEAALRPLKSSVIDKIKAQIPGQFDDMLLDKAYEAILEALTE